MCNQVTCVYLLSPPSAVIWNSYILLNCRALWEFNCVYSPSAGNGVNSRIDLHSAQLPSTEDETVCTRQLKGMSLILEQIYIHSAYFSSVLVFVGWGPPLLPLPAGYQPTPPLTPILRPHVRMDSKRGYYGGGSRCHQIYILLTCRARRMELYVFAKWGNEVKN